jgi:hypothetical protein
LGFGEGVLADGSGSGVEPTACSVAGALAAVVGEAAESDGVGTGLGESLGVGVGVGVGDGDTGGLPLAVGLGLGFGLQLGDGWEDGSGEPDGAAGVPPDDGEVTGDEPGLPARTPPLGWLSPAPLVAVAAEPMLLPELAGATFWVRFCVRAAPEPTTSTNAAAAASGRSQPYGAGAPPAVTGRSQRIAAAGKERRRSMTGPKPDGAVSVASHAAVACRGAWIRVLIRSRPSPSGSTDSAAARRAARRRSS